MKKKVTAWECAPGLPEEAPIDIRHKGKLKVSDQREKAVGKGHFRQKTPHKGMKPQKKQRKF